MRISAGMQVIGFIIILFFALFLYKYFTTDYDKQPAILQHSNQQRYLPNKVVVRDDNESIDNTITMNENDLRIVDNKFNIYQDDHNVSNDGFENELGNKYKNSVNRAFSTELDELYNELMTTFSNESEDYEFVKAQKSDLPIANVPSFLLTKNEPLRLSEKPK